jgi:hypothetical protein
MRLIQKLAGQQYLLLVVSLLALFVVSPFLSVSMLGRLLGGVAFLWIVFSAVWAFHRDEKIATIGVVLGLLLLALTVWNLFDARRWTALVQSSLESAFLLLLIFTILGDVLRQSKVTLNTVYGAICVYLIMGLFWGSLYEVMEITSPGSFSVGRAEFEEHGYGGLIYYSFVTLTTLGYGDITPVSRVAKIFAMLEAIIGQLFLVVTVARLVGLQVAHSGTKGENQQD